MCSTGPADKLSVGLSPTCQRLGTAVSAAMQVLRPWRARPLSPYLHVQHLYPQLPAGPGLTTITPTIIRSAGLGQSGSDLEYGCVAVAFACSGSLALPVQLKAICIFTSPFTPASERTLSGRNSNYFMLRILPRPFLVASFRLKPSYRLP